MLLVTRARVAKPLLRRGGRCHPMTAHDTQSETSHGFSAGRVRLVERLLASSEVLACYRSRVDGRPSR